MLWNKEYLNLYLVLRKSLTIDNIETLTREQIDHIGKHCNKTYYNYYKKQLFFIWFKKNSKNTIKFLKRAEKLINNLTLSFTRKEQEIIDNIEAREFTSRRGMKTIEVPYKNIKYKTTLENSAYFFYKEIKTYEKKYTLLRQTSMGEIYFSPKEIVLYNREKNQIQQVINYASIWNIKLKSYALILTLKSGRKIYLRHKDNEIIYISLKRSFTFKTFIFKTNHKKTENISEKTVEFLLNI